MKLYEEILFLQYYFKGKFVVENVIAFYAPLIKPYNIERHWWWTNFIIAPYTTGKQREHNAGIRKLEERKGFKLLKYKNINRGLALRNCVEPEIGLHVLECALGQNKQKPLL